MILCRCIVHVSCCILHVRKCYSMFQQSSIYNCVESGICRVNQATIVSIPSCRKRMNTQNGSCFNIRQPQGPNDGDSLEGMVKDQVFNIDEVKNAFLIFIGKNDNSVSRDPQSEYFNTLCRVQSTSPSTNCSEYPISQYPLFSTLHYYRN